MKKMKLLHVVMFLTAVFSCTCSTGCFSVALSKANASTDLSTEKIQTYTRVQIDELAPHIERDGSSAVVSFDAIGKFEGEETTTCSFLPGETKQLAFGFFPGAAAEKSIGEKTRDALISFWYNICFAGIPTINGLLLEPFLSASEQGNPNGRIAKSALLGFYKYKAAETTPITEITSRKFEKEKVSVESIQIKGVEINGESRPWGPFQNKIVLSKLKPGEEYRCVVRLSAPADHPLKAGLADFEDVDITILISKE